MAQLKDSVVSGNLRITNQVLANSITSNEGTFNGRATMNDKTLMKKALIIESSTGSYSEGIRINKGNGGYSTLLLGANAGTETSTMDGAWWIGCNNGSFGRKLWITHNGSTNGNTFFYSDDSTSTNTSFITKNCTATGYFGIGGNQAGTTGCKMQFNTTTQAVDFVFA